MKKTILWILAVLVLLIAGYLFIYPYDYIVRFEAKAIPGTINQSIKIWHNSVGVLDTEVSQDNLNELENQVQVGDSVHIYNWKIESINDSTSHVSVRIRDRDYSLMNKIQVPFTDARIERSAVRYVGNFMESLNTHIDQFKVRIEGQAELPSTFYAYVELESSQHGKAGGMMDNFLLLSDVLLQNQVTLNGPPMIIVNEWDREKDSLAYNFCFPIIRSDRLPKHPKIKYKRIFPKKAIKATYNGNYITSDRAWYALLDYAEREGLEVEDTPVEVFFNNPNMGGDALKWEAEIYLPLKEESGLE